MLHTAKIEGVTGIFGNLLPEAMYFVLKTQLAISS